MSARTTWLGAVSQVVMFVVIALSGGMGLIYPSPEQKKISFVINVCVVVFGSLGVVEAIAVLFAVRRRLRIESKTPPKTGSE